MGYNQHHAGLHFCHYPKSDFCTFKYDDLARPLSFDNEKELELFKKQIEEINKEKKTQSVSHKSNIAQIQDNNFDGSYNSVSERDKCRILLELEIKRKNRINQKILEASIEQRQKFLEARNKQENKQQNKRKNKKIPDIYLEEMIWLCPKDYKNLKMISFEFSEVDVSVGYCRKCKQYYCLPSICKKGSTIKNYTIAGSPKIVII